MAPKKQGSTPKAAKSKPSPATKKRSNTGSSRSPKNAKSARAASPPPGPRCTIVTQAGINAMFGISKQDAATAPVAPRPAQDATHAESSDSKTCENIVAESHEPQHDHNAGDVSTSMHEPPDVLPTDAQDGNMSELAEPQNLHDPGCTSTKDAVSAEGDIVGEHVSAQSAQAPTSCADPSHAGAGVVCVPSNEDAPTPENVADVAAELRELTDARLCRLHELMNWPERVLDSMWKSHLGSNDSQPDVSKKRLLLEHIRSCTSGLRISTAFSGIDSPSVSLHGMYSAVAQELELPQPDGPVFDNLYGIEWYSKSQQELQRTPGGPKCLFTDMSEFWQQEFAPKVDSLLDTNQFLDVCRGLLKTVSASTLVKKQAYCINCQKVCNVPCLH